MMYNYAVLTVDETGEIDERILFESEKPDLEFDVFGDDVPMAIASNQYIINLDD